MHLVSIGPQHTEVFVPKADHCDVYINPAGLYADVLIPCTRREQEGRCDICCTRAAFFLQPSLADAIVCLPVFTHTIHFTGTEMPVATKYETKYESIKINQYLPRIATQK